LRVGVAQVCYTKQRAKFTGMAWIAMFKFNLKRACFIGYKYSAPTHSPNGVTKQ